MIHITTKSQFKRDLKLCHKRGKDIDKLENIVNLLQQDQSLSQKYHDHQLTGKWKDHRECHIEPDWLLIYQLTKLNLILVRTGTHSDLFD